MKAVYKCFEELTVFLKDGSKFKTNTDYMNGRICYSYGEVPNGEKIKIDIDKLYSLYPLHLESGTTLIKRKKYEVFNFYPKNRKIYTEDIDSVLLERTYKVIDNPRIDWLEKDLGFKGYSELVFDREQELKNMLLK